MNDLETRSSRYATALQALADLTHTNVVNVVAGTRGIGVLVARRTTADQFGPAVRDALGALVACLDNMAVEHDSRHTTYGGDLGKLRVRVLLPADVVLPATAPIAYRTMQPHDDPMVSAIRALGVLAHACIYAVNLDDTRPGCVVYSGAWTDAEQAAGATLIGCLTDATRTPWTAENGKTYVTVAGSIGDKLPVRMVLSPDDQDRLAGIGVVTLPDAGDRGNPLAALHAAYATLRADGVSSNDVEQWLDDYLTERGFPTVLYA